MQSEQTGPSAAERRLLRRRLRHRGEIPGVVFGMFCTLLATSAAGGVLVLLPIDLLDENSAMEAVLALLVPLALVFMVGIRRARPRATGAPVTAEHYPDLHAMIVEASRAAGLAEPPPAFIGLQNPVEPCRADHGMRRFVSIGTDFYAGCRENGRMDAMRWMIAHEIGHIAAGHGSYWRLLANSMISEAPVLGGLLTRAQEYTADNYAMHIAPAGAIGAIALTATGKDNFVFASGERLASAPAERSDFFLWLVNLVEGTPIVPWRMRAILDRRSPGALVWGPEREAAKTREGDRTT